MGRLRIRQVFSESDYEYIVSVKFQVLAFEEYIKLTHDTIEKEVIKKLAVYEKLMENGSDEEIELLHDPWDHEVKTIITELFYNSLLVSLYSFLEKSMYELCRVAQDGSPVKLKDFGGDGINKYKKYLSKVAGIDFTSLNKEWTYCTKINQFRNIIVHRLGAALKKPSELKLINTLKSIDHIAVKETGEHCRFSIQNETFLTHCLKTMERFLEGIYYEKL